MNLITNRVGNKLAGITLSLSMILSGGTFIAPNLTHAASISTASSTASQIISMGERFMGVPYKFGARTGRTDAFDCSSFVQYVYRLNGVSVPRSSKQQSHAGTFVSRSQLQPGDLVFFYSPIHHVAIYIGNGEILHTYGKPGVTISNLNSGWWNSHYTTARRVLPTNGQAGAAASSQPVVEPASQPAATQVVSQKKPSYVKSASQSRHYKTKYKFRGERENNQHGEHDEHGEY